MKKKPRHLEALIEVNSEFVAEKIESLGLNEITKLHDLPLHLGYYTFFRAPELI